jgi:hypothetical protein
LFELILDRCALWTDSLSTHTNVRAK